MYIEVGAPALLPLGAVTIDEEDQKTAAFLGLTLQHPPSHIFAEKMSKAKMHGARAHIGFERLKKFGAAANMPLQGEFEIELVTPAFIGLGTDAMLGMSVAQALSWLHDADSDDAGMLAVGTGLTASEAIYPAAFQKGGLLLVETASESAAKPVVRQRMEIRHEDEHKAWGVVLFLPRIPAGVDEDMEQVRFQQLLAATADLDGSTGRLVLKDMKTAVKNNDLIAFGRALMLLQEKNRAAMQKAGVPPLAVPEENQKVLNLMQQMGAFAWGQILTGYGCYALVEGGINARDLKVAIQSQVSALSGMVVLTLTDNKGAKSIVRQDQSLKDNKISPVRMNQKLQKKNDDAA